MRKVCRLAREVLDIAAAAIRPGITTDYIDEIVHKACIERNVSSWSAWVLCCWAWGLLWGFWEADPLAWKLVRVALGLKADNVASE